MTLSKLPPTQPGMMMKWCHPESNESIWLVLASSVRGEYIQMDLLGSDGTLLEGYTLSQFTWPSAWEII